MQAYKDSDQFNDGNSESENQFNDNNSESENQFNDSESEKNLKINPIIDLKEDSYKYEVLFE